MKIVSLIEVYRVVSNALCIIRSAHEEAQQHVDLKRTDATREQCRLLCIEEEYLEARLSALIHLIQTAPAHDEENRVQRMRFDIIEYGDTPMCTEMTEKIRDAHKRLFSQSEDQASKRVGKMERAAAA